MNLKIILDEFGVKTEEELSDKLQAVIMKLPCMLCGKERVIDDLVFPQGDPICRYGCDWEFYDNLRL